MPIKTHLPPNPKPIKINISGTGQTDKQMDPCLLYNKEYSLYLNNRQQNLLWDNRFCCYGITDSVGGSFRNRFVKSQLRAQFK